MGALWTVSVTLLLAGAPLVNPRATVETTAVTSLDGDLPAQQLRFPEPRDGRMITYFSTACCGSLVCGGCTCMPFGAMIPLVLLGTQSIPLIVVGTVVGAGVALLGLVSFVGGAAGYATVLITLNRMGLWDSDAAAQSFSDVVAFFSICWSIL
jgi:hypothetical protein